MIPLSHALTHSKLRRADQGKSRTTWYCPKSMTVKSQSLKDQGKSRTYVLSVTVRVCLGRNPLKIRASLGPFITWRAGPAITRRNPLKIRASLGLRVRTSCNRSSRNPLKIRASLGPKAGVIGVAKLSQSLKDQGKSRTQRTRQTRARLLSQSLKDQGKSRTDIERYMGDDETVAIP